MSDSQVLLGENETVWDNGGGCWARTLRQKHGVFVGLAIGLLLVAIVLGVVLPIALAPDDDDDNFKNTSKFTCPTLLVNAITVPALREHLRELEKIALANNNTRAVGTGGYTGSVDYALTMLKRYADCDVSLQPFTVEKPVVLLPPELYEVVPSALQFAASDFNILTYSGAGNVSGVARLPGVSNFGCSADAYDGAFEVGSVALVQRGGSCGFAEKAGFAASAGAVGVLIFNEGNGADRMGVFSGTLGSEASLPVFAIGHELGVSLSQSTPAPTMRMLADTEVQAIETANVLCVSRTGRADRRIIIGAHLDSVPAGPGVNDDGSGVTTTLEAAIQSAALGIQWQNQVTFALWAGEELGVCGSSSDVVV
jgi:Peptidase family M28/PA domain